MTTFLEEAMYHDSQFIAFISPYFAESWQKAIIHCLDKTLIADLRDILDKLPKLMTAEKEATDPPGLRMPRDQAHCERATRR